MSLKQLKQGSVTLPSAGSDVLEGDADFGEEPPYQRVILPDNEWKNPMFHKAPFICTCCAGCAVSSTRTYSDQRGLRALDFLRFGHQVRSAHQLSHTHHHNTACRATCATSSGMAPAPLPAWYDPCVHHQPTTTSQIAIWQGTCYLTPLLGAYLADAHLGRFKVIAIFSTIYFLGTLLLTLTRLLPGLVPEGNDIPASSAQTTVFWMAMYIIALGTGGTMRCDTNATRAASLCHAADNHTIRQ